MASGQQRAQQNIDVLMQCSLTTNCVSNTLLDKSNLEVLF